VLAARAIKRLGQPVAAADMEAAQRAIARTPAETALLRWALWVGAAVYVAVRLVREGHLAWPSGTGLVTVTLLHAGAVAALRALAWERILGEARRTILPNLDASREFAGLYRRRLGQTAAALFGISYAVNAALVSVFTNLLSRQSGTLLSLTLPALVLPLLYWFRSLSRQVVPIEAYFDVAVRNPPARGPARDDPRAIAAFRAAQALPYRVAVYQSLASIVVAVAVVAAGRRLAGFDAAIAGRLLAAMALIGMAMGLYETLLLRDVLRPLLGQLGSRHRLPVVEVRSQVSLRAKLVVFFSSVSVLTAGLVLLFALSPTRAPETMAGSVALAFALALGLVLLIVR